MTLVNETQQDVIYLITCEGMSKAGTLKVNDLAEIPDFDDKADVTIEFRPEDDEFFRITANDTKAGEQVEMTLVAQ